MTIIKETPKRIVVQLDDVLKTRVNVNNVKSVETAFFYSIAVRDYIFYLRIRYKSGTIRMCQYEDPELRNEEFVHLMKWIIVEDMHEKSKDNMD